MISKEAVRRGAIVHVIVKNQTVEALKAMYNYQLCISTIQVCIQI